MCRYTVNFTLEGSSKQVEPSIRLWVDGTSNDLGAEREVTLERCSPTDWQAGFEMPETAPLWFRLGLAAEPGAEWHLVLLREGTREVFRDGDVLTLPKEWVVGTCAG